MIETTKALVLKEGLMLGGLPAVQRQLASACVRRTTHCVKPAGKRGR